jgi:hypothetical protein
MNPRNEALALAYKQLCGDLSKVLYEEDPASVGSAVGAPLDEYEGVAVRLASALRDVHRRDDVASHLRRLVGRSPERLVDRVDKALATFKLRCATAVRTIGDP